MSTTTTTFTSTSNPVRRLDSPSVTANNDMTNGTNTTTTRSTDTHTRVRFDAECVLIPDTSHPSSKRPKLSTKSYSLPLWRKGRDHREEEESHVMLKVNLPSFKSKKSSSHSRERDQRNSSRSPPSAPHHIPSCLRVPTFEHPLPPLPVQEHRPLTALAAVYPSAQVQVLSTGAVPPITIPIRGCCPECLLHTDAPTEEFSRGAMRVRRRGVGFGVGSFSPTGPDNLLFTPPADGTEALDHLVSGIGVANVNRLVAELEERKRRSRSGTPSPAGTPPITPTVAVSPGRISPSLLGPALVRVVESRAPYGAYLSAQELVQAASSSSDNLASHSDTQGRGSPLLPLGIAVDEVDKERRRRSIDLVATIRHHHSGDIIILGEEDEEVDWPRDVTIRKASPSTSKQSSPATSPRLNSKRPPPLHPQGYAEDDEADLFPLPSSSSKPTTPLSTPRHSPHPSPAGSDSSLNLARMTTSTSESVAGRASPLLRDALANNNAKYERRVSASILEGRERSRSEAVCVALGGAGKREREKKEKERETAPNSLHDREGSNASISSISSTASGQLGSHKTAKCERGLLLPPGDERDPTHTAEPRGRGDAASLSSNTSRSSSRDSRCSDNDSGVDEKALPNLPPLATSVLAAGPYSPTLAPRLPVYASLAMLSESESESGEGATMEAREQEEEQTVGRAAGLRVGSPESIHNSKRASLHLRVASAPAAAPSSSSNTSPIAEPPVTSPKALLTSNNSSLSTTLSKPKPAPPITRTGRGKSASTSLTLDKSSSTQPPSPIVRRSNSLARIRSTSVSSVGKGTGRKAFGALVDVLRGVASVGGGGGPTMAV
ncbi:hypothetical protein MIND_01363700 [Mycena indigotica]|uniref:Uncharacterized protein n=1 Tax=Mycena indigotica TaxID=2126181 RepID=A0A8H6S0B6_9AGAR|nr:uncharacterized protein MIND_01363700 [Mycena indigotica]KAF7289890.1 hypothetical protein MIND_01363700 [Mycena indigotica]